jgi:hypothetical protein
VVEPATELSLDVTVDELTPVDEVLPHVGDRSLDLTLGLGPIRPAGPVTGSGRDRTFGRESRRLLRQRASRDDHRALQDRARPAARPQVQGWRTSSSRPSSGSGGSTTTACSSRSVSSHRPSTRQRITFDFKLPRSWRQHKRSPIKPARFSSAPLSVGVCVSLQLAAGSVGKTLAET